MLANIWMFINFEGPMQAGRVSVKFLCFAFTLHPFSPLDQNFFTCVPPRSSCSDFPAS